MSGILNNQAVEVNNGKYSSDKFVLKQYYYRDRRVARIETTGEFEHKDTVEAIETVRSSLEKCYSFSVGFEKILNISGNETCSLIQEHVNGYRQMSENTYKATLEDGQAWELWIQELVLRFMKHKSYVNKFSKLEYDESVPKETKEVVIRTGMHRTKKVSI